MVSRCDWKHFSFTACSFSHSSPLTPAARSVAHSHTLIQIQMQVRIRIFLSVSQTSDWPLMLSGEKNDLFVLGKQEEKEDQMKGKERNEQSGGLIQGFSV